MVAGEKKRHAQKLAALVKSVPSLEDSHKGPDYDASGQCSSLTLRVSGLRYARELALVVKYEEKGADREDELDGG